MDYGYYNDINEMIKAINTALETEGSVGDNLVLSYNDKIGKVKVSIKNRHQFSVKGRMSRILGFGGKDVTIDKTTESPYVAELPLTSTIYVYCNIVQPQIVGDTNAQLLRSIPVRGESGDLITETFSNIQFVPIQTKSFGEVEILLRTDTGDPVPFEHGKVVITLHFRKHTYFT